MPAYGFIKHYDHNISLLFSFPFYTRKGSFEVDVFTCVTKGVPVYFLQTNPYFGDETTAYLDWDADVPRFVFFNQVVLAFIWELQFRVGWVPDMVHVNDWHTGLIPFLIAHSRHEPFWNEIATMMSIHNILYQGNHVGGFLWDAGVPGRHHPTLEALDLTNNMLGIGIAYADRVGTVSPQYAIEIQYPSAGYELTDLIRHRVGDLVGILNGIDTDQWNPATDPYLVSNFDAETFQTHRPPNKAHLQKYAQLEVNAEIPIIAMVSRLTEQKGLDLAIPGLRKLLQQTNAQVIVLGTGDPGIEHALRMLEQEFPYAVRAFLHFDGALAQHIYGGSDIFLMPSHFEPCGIGQMLAMRYGSLPVVRATGGLADTVQNYDDQDAQKGTGFVFHWEEVDAVTNTLLWAIDTFWHRPQAWQQLQARAMQSDFSWASSAEQYVEEYTSTITNVRKGVGTL